MVFIERPEIIQTRSAFKKLISAPPLGEKAKTRLFCSKLRPCSFFFSFPLFAFLAEQMVCIKNDPCYENACLWWDSPKWKLESWVWVGSNSTQQVTTIFKKIFFFLSCLWVTACLKIPNRQAELLSHMPTLCDPLDCNQPGSSVRAISQARMLERVAMPSSRGASRAGDRTHVSCIGRQTLDHWVTGKPVWRLIIS